MGSDLKYKITKVIELKASALQSFNVWKTDASKIAGFAPSLVQSVQVESGDWGTSGSVYLWNYTLGGKSEVFKSEMEFREDKLEVTLTGEEGDPMNEYKVFISSVAFEPQLEGCLATVSDEYQKLNENIPAPENYLEFKALLLQQIDAHVSSLPEI